MHLDTNYLVGLSQNGSSPQRQIAAWLTAGEPLAASAMAWAEYLCGPLQPSEAQTCRGLLHSIHPVGEDVADLGAHLFNATGRRSRSLPDCLIAATAILARQPLASLNASDFQPFAPFGLILA
jgi:predicted nucleic acid-binding protein